MSKSPTILGIDAEQRCKMGMGAQCCVFLAYTPGQGYTCEQHGDFRDIIEARRRNKTMVAESVNCSGAPDFIPTENL